MRKLLAWVLLPPMLLNGLWMVCNPGTTDSMERSQESADCIRICAALEPILGRVCWILPGAAKSSITIVDFGAAVLPIEIVLQSIATNEPLAAELPSLYWNPDLSKLAPPPRV